MTTMYLDPVADAGKFRKDWAYYMVAFTADNNEPVVCGFIMGSHVHKRAEFMSEKGYKLTEVEFGFDPLNFYDTKHS